MGENEGDDPVPLARAVPPIAPQRLVEPNPILFADNRKREIRYYIIAPRYCNYHPRIVAP